MKNIIVYAIDVGWTGSGTACGQNQIQIRVEYLVVLVSLLNAQTNLIMPFKFYDIV